MSLVRVCSAFALLTEALTRTFPEGFGGIDPRFIALEVWALSHGIATLDGIPTAAELPSFEVRSTETPTPLNPLGAKGIGEAATIGSTPAVQNAVIDALAHLGVRHLDMPCTPERVWEAIRAAEAGTLPDPWQEPPALFATLRAGQAADEASVSDAEGI